MYRSTGKKEVNNITRGELIFDESDNEILQKRRMVKKAVLRLSSIFFLLPLILFVAGSFGFLPVKPVELWDIWDALIFSIVLPFCLGLAVLAILASLRSGYVRVFENGIELYVGFPSKVEFFPFDSISSVYVNVLSTTGKRTNFMVLGLKGINNKNYRLLHDNYFVEKERFVQLAEELLPVRHDSVIGRDLLRSL